LTRLKCVCVRERERERERERIEVALIVDKMVENRLRWFGHADRRPIDIVV